MGVGKPRLKQWFCTRTEYLYTYTHIKTLMDTLTIACEWLMSIYIKISKLISRLTHIKKIMQVRSLLCLQQSQRMSLKPLSLCAPQPSSSVSVAPETAIQIDAQRHGLGDTYVLTVPAEFAVHSGNLQYRGSTGVYHYIRRVSNWNMYYNKSSWGQYLDPLVYFIVSFKSDHLLKVCLRFPAPFRVCCLAFKSSTCWPLSELERKKEWDKESRETRVC